MSGAIKPYKKCNEAVTDLVTMGVECLCPTRKNSIIMVNSTVVLRRVVYMGTLTPLIEAIPTTCQQPSPF
jgi:hypothetical protein